MRFKRGGRKVAFPQRKVSGRVTGELYHIILVWKSEVPWKGGLVQRSSLVPGA